MNKFQLCAAAVLATGLTAGIKVRRLVLCARKPDISQDAYLVHLQLIDWLDKAPEKGFTNEQIREHFNINNEFIEMLNQLEKIS